MSEHRGRLDLASVSCDTLGQFGPDRAGSELDKWRGAICPHGGAERAIRPTRG